MIDALNAVVMQIIQAWQDNASVLLFAVALLWGTHLLNVMLGYRLCVLGIDPRTIHGLIGIVFSPLLHGSWQHLFMNTIPGVVLAALVVLNGQETLIGVTLCIMLLSGFGVWMFGRKAVHIGASGVIMGYWGYLLMAAYQQPSLLSIFAGGLCFYYFSEMASNVVPSEVTSSWEGHLLGLLSGILTAFLMPSTQASLF